MERFSPSIQILRDAVDRKIILDIEYPVIYNKIMRFLETKGVQSISGAVITVSSAFSQAPNANTVWLLQNDTVQARMIVCRRAHLLLCTLPWYKLD